MTGQSPADFQARYNQRQSFESKAPFDDLTTEENVPPFSAHPRHQTYNVDPHAMYTGQHHRNPSIPLSQSHSISKHSYGESSSHLPAYPPKPGDSQEVDDRTLWQRILPDSLACRSYVIVVLLQTIVDLAIEAELLIRVTKSLQSSGGTGGAHAKRMPVYLSIFALAHVFQLVMAIDSVINRNTLQFIALAIFNANLLLYSVVQITEVTEAIPGGSDAVSIRALTAAIVAVVALAEVAYIALGWKIYNEFGWKVYKFLGADRRMKKMYETYQIYDCLIKFDVFFWVGFSVQFIWLVLDENDWEYYVTIAALPLSIILLIEGHLAARHENKMMMITFISGCGGAMIYFVYKLVRVLQQKNVGVYFRTWKTLSIFSVIAILLLLATVTFAVITMRNFGRGLKDALARKETVKVPVPGNPHRRVASATLNRMSID